MRILLILLQQGLSAFEKPESPLLLKQKATETRRESGSCSLTIMIGLFKWLLAMIGLSHDEKVVARSGRVRGKHL